MIHSKAPALTIRILFALCLLSFFALIFYLVQFNHPLTDDYVVLLEVKQYGSEYMKFIYGKWSGRLLPAYIFKTLATNDFMFNHYWVHTVAALTLNLLSVVALFWAVNRYIIVFAKNTLTMWSFALVYLAVQITLLPEVASAYYWFSGTIVYQSAIILLQSQLALLIVWHHASRRSVRLLATAGIGIQLVLINFTNEPAVMINGMLLCLIAASGYRKNRLLSIAVFVLLYVLSAYVMISAPGNAKRATEIPSGNFLSAIAFAAGRTAFLFWHLFKNPAFWVAFFSALCLGAIYKDAFLPAPVKLFVRKYHFVLWPVSAALIFITLAPVMYVSNGSFPDRANNLLAQVLFLSLIVAAYFTGSVQRWQISRATLRLTVLGALIISIWCNDFFAELVKTAISAPVYDMVISERQEKMRKAVRSHETVASVQGYEIACDSIINVKFFHERQVMKKFRKEKPTALYLFDDLENDFSRTVLAHYFGLEGLKVVD